MMKPLNGTSNLMHMFARVLEICIGATVQLSGLTLKVVRLSVDRR